MHLGLLRDSLTDNSRVRVLILSTVQTNHFQPVDLGGDVTGLEIGNRAVDRKQMRVLFYNAICSFFFAYLVIQRVVTGNSNGASW